MSTDISSSLERIKSNLNDEAVARNFFGELLSFFGILPSNLDYGILNQVSEFFKTNGISSIDLFHFCNKLDNFTTDSSLNETHKLDIKALVVEFLRSYRDETLMPILKDILSHLKQTYPSYTIGKIHSLTLFGIYRLYRSFVRKCTKEETSFCPFIHIIKSFHYGIGKFFVNLIDIKEFYFLLKNEKNLVEDVELFRECFNKQRFFGFFELFSEEYFQIDVIKVENDIENIEISKMLINFLKMLFGDYQVFLKLKASQKDVVFNFFVEGLEGNAPIDFLNTFLLRLENDELSEDITDNRNISREIQTLSRKFAKSFLLKHIEVLPHIFRQLFSVCRITAKKMFVIPDLVFFSTLVQIYKDLSESCNVQLVCLEDLFNFFFFDDTPSTKLELLSLFVSSKHCIDEDITNMIPNICNYLIVFSTITISHAPNYPSVRFNTVSVNGTVGDNNSTTKFYLYYDLIQKITQSLSILIKKPTGSVLQISTASHSLENISSRNSSLVKRSNNSTLRTAKIQAGLRALPVKIQFSCFFYYFFGGLHSDLAHNFKVSSEKVLLAVLNEAEFYELYEYISRSSSFCSIQISSLETLKPHLFDPDVSSDLNSIIVQFFKELKIMDVTQVGGFSLFRDLFKFLMSAGVIKKNGSILSFHFSIIRIFALNAQHVSPPYDMIIMEKYFFKMLYSIAAFISSNIKSIDSIRLIETPIMRISSRFKARIKGSLKNFSSKQSSESVISSQSAPQLPETVEYKFSQPTTPSTSPKAEETTTPPAIITKSKTYSNSLAFTPTEDLVPPPGIALNPILKSKDLTQEPLLGSLSPSPSVNNSGSMLRSNSNTFSFSDLRKNTSFDFGGFTSLSFIPQPSINTVISDEEREIANAKVLDFVHSTSFQTLPEGFDSFIVKLEESQVLYDSFEKNFTEQILAIVRMLPSQLEKTTFIIRFFEPQLNATSEMVTELSSISPKLFWLHRFMASYADFFKTLNQEISPAFSSNAGLLRAILKFINVDSRMLRVETTTELSKWISTHSRVLNLCKVTNKPQVSNAPQLLAKVFQHSAVLQTFKHILHLVPRYLNLSSKYNNLRSKSTVQFVDYKIILGHLNDMTAVLNVIYRKAMFLNVDIVPSVLNVLRDLFDATYLSPFISSVRLTAAPPRFLRLEAMNWVYSNSPYPLKLSMYQGMPHRLVLMVDKGFQFNQFMGVALEAKPAFFIRPHSHYIVADNSKKLVVVSEPFDKTLTSVVHNMELFESQRHAITQSLLEAVQHLHRNGTYWGCAHPRAISVEVSKSSVAAKIFCSGIYNDSMEMQPRLLRIMRANDVRNLLCILAFVWFYPGVNYTTASQNIMSADLFAENNFVLFDMVRRCLKPGVTLNELPSIEHVKQVLNSQYHHTCSFWIGQTCLDYAHHAPVLNATAQNTNSSSSFFNNTTVLTPVTKAKDILIDQGDMTKTEFFEHLLTQSPVVQFISNLTVNLSKLSSIKVRLRSEEEYYSLSTVLWDLLILFLKDTSTFRQEHYDLYIPIENLPYDRGFIFGRLFLLLFVLGVQLPPLLMSPFPLFVVSHDYELFLNDDSWNFSSGFPFVGFEFGKQAFELNNDSSQNLHVQYRKLFLEKYGTFAEGIRAGFQTCNIVKFLSHNLLMKRFSSDSIWTDLCRWKYNVRFKSISREVRDIFTSTFRSLPELCQLLFWNGVFVDCDAIVVKLLPQPLNFCVLAVGDTSAFFIPDIVDSSVLSNVILSYLFNNISNFSMFSAPDKQ
ncbi:hypothetical protein PCE1_002072 [Barthelona sp. PCE]